jgi:UbiD family decarboxylase
LKDAQINDAMSSPVGGIAPGTEDPRPSVADESSLNGQRPQFAYSDLREWITQADRLGEIRVVPGASWQEDIGMAAEIVQHSDNGPCVIFEDVPGCPKGFRVLTNFFGGKRKNMTLGFSTGLNRLELSEAFLNTYLADLKTRPYQEVSDGPIFENILTGDDVDVTKFPVPIWHERDGGRYIGTGSFNVTRDPEEGWVNCGTYRVMIHDKRTVGFYISPGKHGRIHRDKYQARGELMPTVVVLGGDPLTFLMACSETPYGTCEYDLVGGMRGAPLQVVPGKSA